MSEEKAKSAAKNSKTEKTEKPEQSKKTNKKSTNKGLVWGIIGGAVVAIVAIVVAIIVGTGYHKKTETYTITNDRRGSEVSFEFAGEELGYKTEEYPNGIKFVHPDIKSIITLRLYDTNERDIMKPADAFYSDKYHDWSEIKVGDFEGFKIFRSADLANKVEMGLVLDMYDESKSRVDGLTIIIEQSSMQPREYDWDAISFYESDDFKHLLDTIKFTVNESAE